jgi:hypothetical protein
VILLAALLIPAGRTANLFGRKRGLLLSLRPVAVATARLSGDQRARTAWPAASLRLARAAWWIAGGSALIAVVGVLMVTPTRPQLST